MIDTRLAHLNSNGDTTVILSGDQKEFAELLTDLYSVFVFKPALKKIIDPEQIKNVRDTIQGVFKASA